MLENFIRRTFIILFLLNMLNSCSVEEGYKSLSKRAVDVELERFFPNEIESKEPFRFHYLKNPINNNAETEIYTIYLTYTPSNFESVTREILEKSVATYQLDDGCNLVIGKFQSRETSPVKGHRYLYKKWFSDHEKCLEDKFPIPNYLGAEIDKNDEYKLYILESKSGIYFADKYYTNEIPMPYQWKRGYSNGVAVNESKRELLYWLVIW